MKTIQFKLLLFAILILLINEKVFCQETKIDEIRLSIGESLEEVLERFEVPSYIVLQDTSKTNIHCTIFKKMLQTDKYSNNSARAIAYLDFTHNLQYLSTNHQTELYRIEKVWSDYYKDDAFSIINTLLNIIEKNNIDEYSISINLTKSLEPDYLKRSLSIRLNNYTSLEIYFLDNGYYEISEVIKKNENFFSDQDYILIFKDDKHYFTNNDYLFESYSSKTKVLERLKELRMKYLISGDEEPESKINRFYTLPKLFKKQ